MRLLIVDLDRPMVHILSAVKAEDQKVQWGDEDREDQEHNS